MATSRPLGGLQNPQWFIQLDNDKLRVNEDVLKDLKALSSYLLVISIAGSYRTGKSWILSHLAGCGAKNGFTVADGQSAVTSGIWILCKQHPNKENCVVVFLDNEGLHDPFKNDTANDDNRHFILSFLLSDIFIFNAMQKFDNSDLEKIGFITMISKKLQKADAQKSFPEFLLLLRDVSKVKLQGQEVLPAKYLEDVLNSCDDDDGDRFSPKWCIRKYCQKRKCFTLTQPVEFEDLTNLGQMEEPALRSRFLDDVNKLKNHLFKNSDIKKFTNGSPYTTSAFCDYVVALKENVEDGVIPKITSLQQRILDDENVRVWDETVKRFSAAIRNDENSDLYGSFGERFRALQRQGIEQLEYRLVPKTEDHRDETIRQFKELTDEECLKVSAERSRDFLSGSLEPYFLKVDDNLYKAPNAKETFERDVMKVKEKYEKKKDLGPEKMNIWTEVERIIKRKCKELELVDLRHQLQETDRANVEEKKRLEQLVRKMESDINEQNIEMRKKERELEQKKAQAEFEIDQKMKKAEAELDRQKKDLITDIQTMQEKMVQTITEERQQQIESANNANIISSLIDGVALFGASVIMALKK